MAFLMDFILPFKKRKFEKRGTIGLSIEKGLRGDSTRQFPSPSRFGWILKPWGI